jgi:AcrR family transcriptional regulator
LQGSTETFWKDGTMGGQNRATTTLEERRPRRADAARNFDALVAAGREAFAEDGSGASLEDIARRAGVGIGTLYRNFPTRDDLIETLYLREVAALADAADEVADLAPWPALEAWLGRFVEYVGTKHVLLDGLNRESSVFAECRGVMLGAGAAARPCAGGRRRQGGSRDRRRGQARRRRERGGLRRRGAAPSRARPRDRIAALLELCPRADLRAVRSEKCTHLGRIREIAPKIAYISVRRTGRVRPGRTAPAL